jgi:ribulose kinase
MTDRAFTKSDQRLTFRASGGNRARSCCSLGCKCGFVGKDWGEPGVEGWAEDLFKHVGLGELASFRVIIIRI